MNVDVCPVLCLIDDVIVMIIMGMWEVWWVSPSRFELFVCTEATEARPRPLDTDK